MKATKIKMKPGCGSSDNLLEIDQIYLEGCLDEKFYFREAVFGFVKENPGLIQVNISPYPDVMGEVGTNGEKYVHTQLDDTKTDYLLKLPRE